MTKGTVLVVGSNATRIELRGGGSAAIGQYLNETVVPHVPRASTPATRP